MDKSPIFGSHEYRDGATVYVVPSGEIDVVTSAAFGTVLLVAGERASRVSLDFSKVTFFDLAAMRELSRVRAALAERGVALVLTNVPPLVVRVLEITELYHSFDIRVTTAATPGALAEDD